MKTKKAEFFDDKMSVGTGFSRIEHRTCASGTWVDGEIGTIHGFVSVQAEPKENGNNFTRLDFVHKGTNYIRTYQRYFKPRAITTLAKRFAQSIVDRKKSGG